MSQPKRLNSPVKATHSYKSQELGSVFHSRSVAVHSVLLKVVFH